MAYDVLKAIYLERGYRLRDIPRLILEKNLYGLDIDDRAAQLAGFALLMKAREDDRRLLDEPPRLNVLAIQESKGMDVDELGSHLAPFGLQSASLKALLETFGHARTCGSLIQMPAELNAQLASMTAGLRQALQSGDLYAQQAARDVMPLIWQALVLGMQFDAVVANPPYMGMKGMNTVLKEFANEQLPNSKTDLFAMFIERGFEWCKPSGLNSMVTMQSWMFLSSYQELRVALLRNRTLFCMVHMGNGVLGIAFGTAATVFLKSHISSYVSGFSHCSSQDINSKGIPEAFPVNNCRNKIAKPDDFSRIPGSPIAYWAGRAFVDCFSKGKTLEDVATPRQGLSTTNNDIFLRQWFEVPIPRTCFSADSRSAAMDSKGKWFPYSKGGEARRWYGNHDYVVNWECDGRDVKVFIKDKNPNVARGEQNYFKQAVTWSLTSSSRFGFAARLRPKGFVFDINGMSSFPADHFLIVALLNSKASDALLKIINPTMAFQVGDIKQIRVADQIDVKNATLIAQAAINISKEDWDAVETSWGFSNFPWLSQFSSGASLLTSWMEWQNKCVSRIADLKRLDEENNRLFIKAYGLQDELSPDVPEDQITLARADREKDCQRLISYTLGCMMGRYRLDRPGLIYAHSGNEQFWQIYEEGTRDQGLGVSEECGTDAVSANPYPLTPNPSPNPFPADADGIIPITDEPWFDDDVAQRIREFLLAVWGPETLDENMAWLAESLGKKANETPDETIRRYLADKFFKDHLQTYKKRPIYWLFSSGKQGAFQALVYLHRYNEGTLARMRNAYVIPLAGKIAGRIDLLEQEVANASSTSFRTKAQKALDAMRRKQAELVAYDEQLRHYADMRIQLDLDDGVKVNYGKFGNLLAEVKAVTGGGGDD